jgi:hypothetical protein
MGKVSYKELNIKKQEMYITMERYIRCSNILDFYKEECIKKVSEIVFKINKQHKYVENVIGDPKAYCDEVINPYKEKTSKFSIFIEYLKKFSLILSIFTLIISLLDPLSKVNLYGITIITLTILCSISIDYINRIEAEMMLFLTLKSQKIEFKNIKYKLLTTTMVILLFISVFFTKDSLVNIKTIISVWSICLLSIGSYIYSKVYTNRLTKELKL